MPRCFFDTDDGNFDHHDATGQELPDHKTARWVAVDTLPDMAREKLPDGDRRAFTVQVRDEAGTVIYSASLDLVGQWHVTPPAD